MALCRNVNNLTRFENKMNQKPIKVILYRWAGSWGPFKIKIPCGECTLTKDVILDTLEKELSGIPVELELREWLSEWWKPLINGGWHAPIVIIGNKLISQGSAMNRGLLTQAVIEVHASRQKLEGSHLFGKLSCPHCKRAKEYLRKTQIPYEYHDVVGNPRDLYEMLARVKPLIGSKVPVTVPQIWIDGDYIGGADQLITL